MQLPLAQHLGRGARQPLERGHGLFGAVFLDEADHGVQRHDDDDGYRIAEFADHARDDAGQDQHHDHEVGELAQEHPHRPACTLLANDVRTMEFQTLLCLLMFQPLFRVDLQPGHRLPGFQEMPGRCGVRFGFGLASRVHDADME